MAGFIVPASAKWHSGQLTERRAQFAIPAEAVSKLNLPWCPTLCLEQFRRTDQDRHAPCPRRSDVEPVQAIQELHATRCISMSGRCHRVDGNRRFLSLELIDCADSNTRNMLLNLKH